MRRWFRWLHGLAGGLALTACSQGPQEHSARELALQAVRAGMDNGAYEALTEQAVAAAIGIARLRVETGSRSLTADQSRQLEATIRRTLTEVYPRAQWEEALLTLYLNRFSIEELREVVRLHQTPIIGRLLVVQAQLATGGGPIGQELMRSRQAEFTRRLSEGLAAAWQTPPAR
jgi:hypothetical protein